MDYGDRVRLAACRKRHNRHLKAKVGEVGTVRDFQKDQMLVAFDDAYGSQFWIKPRWLEPVDDPSEWMRVVIVDDAERAFPVGAWQPEWDAIPARYKHGQQPNSHNPGVLAGAAIFYGRRCATDFHGLPREPLVTESGDPATADDAWRMIEVIMGSCRFRQEHKEALLGWAIESVFRVFWFTGDEPDFIREQPAAAADNQKDDQ